MIRLLLIVLASTACIHAATLTADSARGERLFESLYCIQCHSVNGHGGHVAADLGRRIDRNFTPGTLASTMWNHAPTMWAAMRERGYFYSARFFEKPGDAGRGKRLFTDRACAQCHGLTEPIKPGVKPVSQWAGLADPIALTEGMWNHLPSMWAALEVKRVRWPQLTGQDLTDLLVYLRNLPGTREKRGVFETSLGTKGEAIFKSKGCFDCHSGYASLADQIKGRTLTEIAAAMWNHGSSMPAAPEPFAAGEMRELLSYLWARQFFEDAGDAGRGKRVFAAKHCATCHNDASTGAPKLAGGQRSFTGATMVSALWHHGPRMLEQMNDRRIRWPHFDGREMSNLIAYLNAGERAK